MKTFLDNENLSINSDFSHFENVLDDLESKEEDFKTEINTVRNSKISKKTFTNKYNIFDIKERMENILDNKKKIQEIEINNENIHNKNLTFSNLCFNLDEQSEINHHSAFYKYFITLLHLSNEKNLILEKTNGDDINIKF